MNINQSEKLHTTPEEVEADYIQLGSHLEEIGIRRTHLSRKLDRTPAWLTGVLQGAIKISEPMKAKIEEALKTSNFKFKTASDEQRKP